MDKIWHYLIRQRLKIVTGEIEDPGFNESLVSRSRWRYDFVKTKENIMAMFPALMNNSIFGDFFDDPFFNNWADPRRQNDGKELLPGSLMNTDVREVGDHYQLSVDMPGFDKNDISLRLENGYLIVSAQKKSDQGDKDDKGRWIRRERYTGSCSRSFYVGEKVRQEDIQAKYQNGTLEVSLPKSSLNQVENKQSIAIEG